MKAAADACHDAILFQSTVKIPRFELMVDTSSARESIERTGDLFETMEDRAWSLSCQGKSWDAAATAVVIIADSPDSESPLEGKTPGVDDLTLSTAPSGSRRRGGGGSGGGVVGDVVDGEAKEMDGGAFVKSGKAQRDWTRGIVVADELNPSGGLVVLDSGIVVVGDAGRHTVRLFRTGRDGKFIECGSVGADDLEGLGQPRAEAPEFLMRCLAARQHNNQIEIIFADNACQSSMTSALFRILLRKAETSEGEIAASHQADVEGAPRQWLAVAWERFADCSDGPGQVFDPAAVSFVPDSASPHLVVLDRLWNDHREFKLRFRVLELPPIPSSNTPSVILTFKSEEIHPERRFVPMVVSASGDIVVALKFEIRKYNINREMERRRRAIEEKRRI